MFPENINTFVDLFGGAFNVGINIEANKIIYNDIIHFISEIFKEWQGKSLSDTNNYIDDTIKKFNLSPLNKKEFEIFREHYNLTKNPADLFILICYSFNYQIRFNNNLKYNSSFGKEASTMNSGIRKNLNKFIEKIQSKNIEFQTKDFDKFDFSDLESGDFVYCDPPYLISGAVYQDGKRGFKGWSQEDDLKLFKILDELNERQIKFALSNMTYSKSRYNEKLIDWASKYNTYNLKMNYNGCNYQRKADGEHKDIEVLITNY